MIPETIKLTDWNTTDNLHNDTVLLYPSRSEFVDIFKKLRDVWGNARFSDTAEQVPIVEPEVNVPIGFNDNLEVPLVVDVLPVIETWVLQCGTDNNGDKYLVVIKQCLHFHIQSFLSLIMNEMLDKRHNIFYIAEFSRSR